MGGGKPWAMAGRRQEAVGMAGAALYMALNNLKSS